MSVTDWEKLYPLLSEEKREEWARRYKEKFGKDFIPPERTVDLENEIMKQNYTISVEGRK